MPQYSQNLHPTNNGDQYRDHQEYTIRDASVSVDLPALANDIETNQRRLSYYLGLNKYLPVDGPTGSSMQVQLLHEQQPIISACEIAAIQPLQTEPDGPVHAAVWLRGQSRGTTVFASVHDAQMKFPTVLQRVIVAPGDHAPLTTAAVDDFFDQTA